MWISAHGAIRPRKSVSEMTSPSTSEIAPTLAEEGAFAIRPIGEQPGHHDLAIERHSRRHLRRVRRIERPEIGLRRARRPYRGCRVSG